jgi:vacuolar-type H+-ATPase subunit H
LGSSLAKEKTVHTDNTPPSTSHSAVETIVSALSELENDIDRLYGRVEEMKKRLVVHSNEEVDKLKQQVITLANEEAKQIVNSTKAEAEAESENIGEMGRANLANIRKNIKASFDSAVDSIVQSVLGGGATIIPPTPAVTQEIEKNSEQPAAATQAKIKKYTSDGKPAG